MVLMESSEIPAQSDTSLVCESLVCSAAQSREPFLIPSARQSTSSWSHGQKERRTQDCFRDTE
jgi:hypothetical protein